MSHVESHTELVVFSILYGGTALTALIGSIYLCLRRGNAFAADTTSPVALRRWTAAFLATAFMSHVWWMPFYLNPDDIHSVSCLIVAMLDCVGLLITIPGMLFAMLQDRRRRVWPIASAAIPYAVLGILYITSSDNSFLYLAATYIILVYALISVKMMLAVRQYRRWLRDNYADLEHKEVWVNHLLVLVIFVLIVADSFTFNFIVNDLVQIIEIAFFVFLLWRVETLPQLANDDLTPDPISEQSSPTRSLSPKGEGSVIEQLLVDRCVTTQLYLQHDLTVQQLAQTIGTNRTYLSQYFSSQDTTYNAYISDLRINHFMRLFREANAAQRHFTAQELAAQSGYRSYSTFSHAFKQRTGQSVSEWMNEEGA